MTHPNAPTIPDDKKRYFEDQLYRELSHMFKWEGLPQTVPQDYLERNLVKTGHVLFYMNEKIGLDVLRATPTGYNRHELPTTARATIATTNQEIDSTIERKVKRLADSDIAQSEFDELTDGVLIANMPYGQTCKGIVDHFTERLALTQQAFDTNLMWQNIPYFFQVEDNNMKLSIIKMFSDIYNGVPLIQVDKQLLRANEDRGGVPTEIPFIADKLMDTRNEIMMHFRQTIGIETAGVDKAERTNTVEIKSNEQHTNTVLQVMLHQREKAVEDINAFFGTSISVGVVGNNEEEQGEQEEQGEEGGEEIGTSDSGTEGLNRED